MVLVQLYLPIVESAERDPRALLDQVRGELTERFGGVTASLRAPASGLWRAPDGQVQADRVVIVEVMAEALDRAWWGHYRRELEARFGQQEMVVRALGCEKL